MSHSGTQRGAAVGGLDPHVPFLTQSLYQSVSFHGAVKTCEANELDERISSLWCKEVGYQRKREKPTKTEHGGPIQARQRAEATEQTALKSGLAGELKVYWDPLT